jgi:protein TonB
MVLHACLILPIVAWMLYAPRPRHSRANPLNVQVVGIVADRQMLAQPRRIESPVPKSAGPKLESKENKPVEVPKQQASNEPHLQPVEPTNAPEALRLPQSASTERKEPNQSAARPQAGAESEQPQQTIAVHNDMNDRIAAYIAQLAKQLQSNLIYPPDAKKKRIEGTTLVSFVVTESGGIQPSSLMVKRSSGSGVLDASALHTVASSAPFLRPPRELNVSIELEFEVDSKVF